MKYIAILNGKKYEIELIRVPEYEMRPRMGQNEIAMETIVNKSIEGTEDLKPETVSVNEPAIVKTHTDKYVIESPLPGKVLNVNASVGQMVGSGDVIMTIEAMKMETEILAKEDGKISSVNVKAGDTVNTGEVLIVIND